MLRAATPEKLQQAIEFEAILDQGGSSEDSSDEDLVSPIEQPREAKRVYFHLSSMHHSLIGSLSNTSIF